MARRRGARATRRAAHRHPVLLLELDAARARARRLARHHHGRRGGEEEEERQLRRQLTEEARAWKARHREKAAAAARLVASELDGERRARRRAERVGEEEEEELRRREAEAAREEMEREHEMLRVQMKLAEARIQFEEKNAAVNRLRQELEAFLELQEWEDDGCSDGRASSRDMDEDAERYEAIKNLREQMLAGHGFVFLSQHRPPRRIWEEGEDRGERTTAVVDGGRACG